MRFAAADFEVLGRDAVGQFTGLFHAAGVDHYAAALQALGNDGGTGQRVEQTLHFALHSVDIGGVRAQQNGLRQLIVFGLAEQVHGHPFWRCAPVGQHQDLAWSGDHVDANRAEHPALGAGHVGVTGAGDLVHFWDGGRAIGERRNGLRAADGEGAVHARHIGGSQHQRAAFAMCGSGFWCVQVVVGRAVARGRFMVMRSRFRHDACAARGHAAPHGRGHDHDDFLHASHVRRHGVHDQAAGIGGLAARNVDAHAIQRRDFLSEQAAVGVAVAPAFAGMFLLCFMVAAHARHGSLQGILLSGGQAVESCLEIVLREFQRLHAAGLQTIEAGRVFKHGRIAARVHVGQDVGYALFDRGVGVGAPVQAAGEGGFKIRLGGFQPQGTGVQGRGV